MTTGMPAIAEHLQVAGQRLAITASEEAVSEALADLKRVEAGLLELACCPSTDVQAASLLVRVRDDLSAHLLAAAVVMQAGGDASENGCDILRRAVASTVSRLGLVLPSVVPAVRRVPVRPE